MYLEPITNNPVRLSSNRVPRSGGAFSRLKPIASVQCVSWPPEHPSDPTRLKPIHHSHVPSTLDLERLQDPINPLEIALVQLNLRAQRILPHSIRLA